MNKDKQKSFDKWLNNNPSIKQTVLDMVSEMIDIIISDEPDVYINVKDGSSEPISYKNPNDNQNIKDSYIISHYLYPNEDGTNHVTKKEYNEVLKRRK